ncbi:hypothetical protein LTR53_019240, partial [Teratosphaeriaceae sp. CCFEE 6253]
SGVDYWEGDRGGGRGRDLVGELFDRRSLRAAGEDTGADGRDRGDVRGGLGVRAADRRRLHEPGLVEVVLLE